MTLTLNWDWSSEEKADGQEADDKPGRLFQRSSDENWEINQWLPEKIKYVGHV